jgi:hypothetical protein
MIFDNLNEHDRIEIQKGRAKLDRLVKHLNESSSRQALRKSQGEDNHDEDPRTPPPTQRGRARSRGLTSQAQPSEPLEIVEDSSAPRPGDAPVDGLAQDLANPTWFVPPAHRVQSRELGEGRT